MTAARTWEFASIEQKNVFAQNNYSKLFSLYSWDQDTISFSFPLTAFPGTGSYVPAGESLQYTPFTQHEINMALEVFDVIERFLDIDFVYDPSGNGEMKIGHQNMTAGGYAQYPYPGSNHAILVADNQPIGKLGYGIQTLIHEIGHSLGLKHSHERTALSEKLDLNTATIMSYDRLAVNGSEFHVLNSFMMMDILALQAMYGVSTKVSDDRYTADNGISVIADYGGVDTIDISTQSYDRRDINIVDLKRGYVFYDKEYAQWQSTIYDHESGQWTGWRARSADNGFYNMMIMPGSTIEIVVGSAVRDRLIGDAFANTISGGQGNDRMVGGVGADTLTGGAGKDVFIYRRIGESSGEMDVFDVIRDFSQSQGDRIDVSGIDANFGRSGNQTFRFDPQGDGIGKTGQISYKIEGGNTHIYANTDKDSDPEFHIVLNGEYVLRASDFIL
jgi:hypothetical protein